MAIARLLPLVLILVLAAPARPDDAQMFDPRFREGAPSDALVKGPPRLSRGHLNAYVDMLEAALDIALSAEDEQALRDALENRFDAANAKDREAFLSTTDLIVPMREQARRGNGASVHEMLRRFRGGMDEQIRAKPTDTVSVLITRAVKRRHEVLGTGEPPLKGMAADAYIELVEFIASLARNQRVRLSPGRRSALRDYMAKDLLKLDRKVREKLARAHRFWLRTKARWDHSKDVRRFLLRWEAVKLAARLTPGTMKIAPGNELTAYARESARVAGAMEAFDAVTALGRNPAALFEAVTKGLALKDPEPTFSFMYR